MATTLRSLLAVPTLVAVLATAAAAPAAVSAAGPPSGAGASTLEWSACAEPELAGFECGTLTVPLDRADPSGATIDLAVARHRSAGKASQRIGSLVFNPGGPGGSGLESLPTIWRVLPAAAKARFDLVTWDPRGMGASTPLQDCATISMPLPATGTVDWLSVYADMRMDRAAANARCVAKNATLVAHMGTMEVVNDLDALRAAVGDAKLTYWGMSYGTRIGYSYALRYPEKVRAIVLDGTVDPSSSIVDLATSATARDQALGFFFELWPKAAEQYRRVRAALDERTVALPSGDVMTRWNFDAMLDSAAGGEFGLRRPREGHRGGGCGNLRDRQGGRGREGAARPGPSAAGDRPRRAGLLARQLHRLPRPADAGAAGRDLHVGPDPGADRRLAAGLQHRVDVRGILGAR